MRRSRSDNNEREIKPKTFRDANMCNAGTVTRASSMGTVELAFSSLS